MPLNKPSGHMYPDTYTWNPLGGACPHKCVYCYAHNKIYPWQRRLGNAKYVGNPHLIKSELETRLIVPEDYMIFIQSLGDLLAWNVLPEDLQAILDHCKNYPETLFLLQSKNPARFFAYLQHLPKEVVLGTTIETNRPYHTYNGKTPSWREDRYKIMRFLERLGFKIMISIEPIMDFDLADFVDWFKDIEPWYVSIGADSGENHLAEPPAWKVARLISDLREITEVKIKPNLERLRMEASL